MRSGRLAVVALGAALALAALAAAAPAAEKKEAAPKPGAARMERAAPPGPGMPGCGMGAGMGAGMEGCCLQGHGAMRGGMGMGRGMGMGPGGARLRALGLTPEQMKKLADIRDRQERGAIQARADLATAALDLRQALRADKPDRMKIDGLIDKMARLRAGLQKARVASLLEMRALLTPEQLEKWRSGAPDPEEGEED